MCIRDRNIDVVCASLNILIQGIKKYSTFVAGQEFEKTKLVFIDLILRMYPNIRAIHGLLIDYKEYKNTGNLLPAGLIVRCCLEDVLQMAYFLIFEENPEIMESEINISSSKSIGKNFRDYIKKIPEYWICPQSEKEQLTCELNKRYLELQKRCPFYFNPTTCNIKKTKEFRRECANVMKYFDNGIGKILEGDNVKFIYELLERKDKEFSYVYMLYKYFCLFEHYTYFSRKAPSLNDSSFLQLILSLEYIQRGGIRSFLYLDVEKHFIDDIMRSKSVLQSLVK